MIFVFLILFIIVVSTLNIVVVASNNETDKGKNLLLLSVFMVLTIIMGLRDKTVGIDTIEYYYTYIQFSTTSWTSILSDFYYGHIEVGYIILNKLCSEIYNDYLFFQFVEAFLYCFLMMRFIKRNSKNHVLCTMIFVAVSYLAAFNIYRQMLAVALMCNAWDFLKDKRFWIAAIFSALGVCIHSTAYVFIFAFIAYFLREKKWIMFLCPLFLIMFMLSFSKIIDFAENSISQYAGYFNNNSTKVTANAIIVVWLIEIVLSVFLIYGKNSSGFQRFIGVMTLTTVMSVYVGTSLFNYFERLGLYFTPFSFLLYEEVANHIEDRDVKKLFYVGVYNCYLLLFWVSSLWIRESYEWYL